MIKPVFCSSRDYALFRNLGLPSILRTFEIDVLKVVRKGRDMAAGVGLPVRSEIKPLGKEEG